MLAMLLFASWGGMLFWVHRAEPLAGCGAAPRKEKDAIAKLLESQKRKIYDVEKIMCGDIGRYLITDADSVGQDEIIVFVAKNFFKNRTTVSRSPSARVRSRGPSRL